MNNSKLIRQELLAAGVAVLALGWAMHGLWNLDETTKIVRLARNGATANEIGELVTQLWHNDSAIWLKNAATPLSRTVSSGGIPRLRPPTRAGCPQGQPTVRGRQPRGPRPRQGRGAL